MRVRTVDNSHSDSRTSTPARTAETRDISVLVEFFKARDVLLDRRRRTPMNNRNGTGTMDEAQDKIGEKLDERIDSIKEQVKGLVDKGEQRAAAIKNRAIEVKDEAFSKGNAVLDQVTGYIKSNPLKAIGIAFGAGYVGMRIFR